MHWLLWVTLILLVLLILLLSLPLQIEIDTDAGIFRVEWKGIGGARLAVVEDEFRFFYKIFFWERTWHFSAAKKKKSEKRGREMARRKSRKKGSFMTPGRIFVLMRNMLNAIKVRRFHIDIDTDDYARNARLYPFFLLLSNGKRQLHINFQGRQDVFILVQTRLASLAGAFLRTFIHR